MRLHASDLVCHLHSSSFSISSAPCNKQTCVSGNSRRSRTNHFQPHLIEQFAFLRLDCLQRTTQRSPTIRAPCHFVSPTATAPRRAEAVIPRRNTYLKAGGEGLAGLSPPAHRRAPGGFRKRQRAPTKHARHHIARRNSAITATHNIPGGLCRDLTDAGAMPRTV